MLRIALLAGVWLMITMTLRGQVPYALSPTWTSGDASSVSTGCAWADINRDGWLDLVVANGNDMARQRLVVYYNSGAGTLPSLPNWQSADIDYHGHLSIGDVNNDGWPDVAVSVYIGPAGFSQKGKVKLYINNNGTLSSNPVWTSADNVYSFSCAFGDADGDGDLDLAVAGGEAYGSRAEQNRIYFNRQGRLDSLPGWKSNAAGYSYDVTWADFDNDGDLDLVFANERGPNHIYRNYGDSIGVVPVWSSSDPSMQANSLFVGDVNNDGYVDLAISDNNQLGGTGRFKLYKNLAGTIETTPFWTSAFSGYGSGITLADIDNDGDLDLITGGWWNPLRIYTNAGGAFTPNPQYTSSTNSVVEAIVCGDMDNDRLDTLTYQTVVTGGKRVLYLPRIHVQRLLNVLVNGIPDSLGRYCYDLENGWISFGPHLQNGSTVTIMYVASRDLDLGISNWDSNKGNYVFKSDYSLDVINAPDISSGPLLIENYPNPFNPHTTIRYAVNTHGVVRLGVFNALGQQISSLVNEEQSAGTYSVLWEPVNMAGGVYFVRLQSGGGVTTLPVSYVK